MAQNTRPTLLVSKPADEITWQDVIQFCELQKPESAILDYKREFPERLENVLVAMANTYGGTVIVGVTEDPKTTKPLAPFSGIEFKRGLQDRVQQVVSSHIRPLLSTQVAVAVNEEETRAFVVIRIDQSPLAPHAVDGEAIYIRTGNRNQPETLANADRILWLANHRERAVSLRRAMLLQSDKRCAKFGSLPRHPELTISLCPTYPGDSFASPRELESIYRDIRVRDYFGSDHQFPIGINPRTVQDGIVSVVKVPDAPIFFYVELSSSGLYYARQTLQGKPIGEASNLKETLRVRCAEPIARVDEVVQSAAAFYERIGYGGPLELSFVLSRASTCQLIIDALPNQFGSEGQLCPDDEIRFETRLSANTLRDARRTIVLSCAGRVFDAFGANVGDKYVDQIVKQMSGQTLA